MKFIYKNIDEGNILKNYQQNKIYGTQIKQIIDPTHACAEQNGLFATKEWEPYDVIGEYTGKVTETLNQSDYLIAFSNISYSICLDAQDFGNETRYINHYKNIKKIPNTKFVTTYINCKPMILVIVTEKIKIGDEILVDYCYDF
ncbi:MAG: hypothetical protein CML47_01435 [Rhodobacteraceae bacterium]|nr:MAG: hypothetical protein CML47_01435 [Paracoccaceae bacterium]|tara:strand:+ start:912 stop:1343 length:432 start_codon:yes stop_codon:yes gene_type:complete